jgi:hypothetical protein
MNIIRKLFGKKELQPKCEHEWHEYKHDTSGEFKWRQCLKCKQRQVLLNEWLNYGS